METSQTFDNIIAHVANGGSLVELVRMWKVRYSDIVRWIYADSERKVAYETALVQQTQWAMARFLDELRAIGLVDIRKAYDADGRLLSIEKMPDEIAHVIAGVNVFEEYDGRGEDRKLVGHTRKIKLWDKLKALELLGKNLSMFKERVEVSGKVSLEELVAGSMPSQQNTGE